MAVYDKAHELARALKTSDEYRAFLQAKAVVESDETAKKMIKEFITKQMEIEYERMAGRTEDKDKVEKLQKMAELLQYNSKAAEFLRVYMRFQMLMGDIYKIIGESVAEGMDFIAKE